MNPKLCKRLLEPQGTSSTTIDNMSSDDDDDEEMSFAKTSVRDQAALLLSIADIAKSELGSNGLEALWDDDNEDLKFPLLTAGGGTDRKKFFAPRTEALTDLIGKAPTTSFFPNMRLRTVSLDFPHTDPTPVSPNPTKPTVTPMQSPLTRIPVRKHHQQPLRALRQSARTKQQQQQRIELTVSHSSDDDDDDTDDAADQQHHAASFMEDKNRPLQGACPKGVAIKKIMRRKFSWKNYPELEQFLIANREEYLRHSALNYTVQQKQYNNRLTDRLLELASEHGYVFDEKEFSFVTVRDRIRCYYKSYVQSAKKRGVLMGYAARKAGLLSEKDLEKSTGKAAQIVFP